MLCTATTTNTKTGNVPSIAIGATREESFDSCGDCSQLKANSETGKARCYSQYGQMGKAHAGMARALAKGKDYSLDKALKGRWWGARMVRFGSVGDPAAVSRLALSLAFKKVAKAGLAAVGYTHHWEQARNEWLKPHLMASCDSVEHADKAFAEGWRPAAVVPTEWAYGPTKRLTPEGNPLQMCPAIVAKAKGKRAVTCNDCRLCQPDAPGAFGIGFPYHGPGVRIGPAHNPALKEAA